MTSNLPNGGSSSHFANGRGSASQQPSQSTPSTQLTASTAEMNMNTNNNIVGTGGGTNGDISIPDAAPIEIDDSDEDEEEEEEEEGDDGDEDEEEGEEDSGSEGGGGNVVRPTRVFTPSERIQQLNQVDKEISSLLLHAGLAIESLSAPPTDSSRTAFTAHTKSYHALLSSIIVNIRRQMFALEQAGIPVPVVGGAGKKESGLDVGEISGRSDRVGRVKEAELWKRAREAVEGKGSAGGGRGDEGQRMDLDLDVEVGLGGNGRDGEGDKTDVE